MKDATWNIGGSVRKTLCTSEVHGNAILIQGLLRFDPFVISRPDAKAEFARGSRHLESLIYVNRPLED
jgi:hypothetical protein